MLVIDTNSERPITRSEGPHSVQSGLAALRQAKLKPR